MGLRLITAVHNGYDFEARSLATAVQLAKENGALLRVIHVDYLNWPNTAYFGSIPAVGTGAALQEAISRQARADLDRSRSSTEAICKAQGLPLSEGASQERPRAEFVPMEAVSNQRLARDLTVTDLIVVGVQGGSKAWVEGSVANIALFSTGRPILVVQAGDHGDAAPITGVPACVAWRDTPEAIHAVLTARPLLSSASSVHITVADGEGRAAGDTQPLIQQYLAAYDVEASFQVLSRDGRSAAGAVLSHAREVSCGFLVMGAYGHSMFREALLGGFTETMLEEADLPLVLCH